MANYKQLCAELLKGYEILLGDLKFDNRLAKRARAALAEPEPEGPTDEPMIPDHYRGDDIRVYREGFHAGYKYAFQLIEKHSDV